ncbi:hypothetical protein HDG34_002540 [Paraburkholderia sp. HC6.4b]|uniref:hypothetical protein n=1 Tax=unclassified Paraburkholderia TaxID=2615204 RepID=UPI00161A01F8|nr:MULTISPECIES: hypothetical protein [unclassified Paraburkholderia]MBB5408603.1 hypothetical protein [Paraburkholderia sp. HC6.4b]MBB5450435.1 hypothetical protein [Paraburkholderia sp. Kb1A]
MDRARIRPLPMLGRRQVRLAALGALERAELQVAGRAVLIRSPGDWSAPSDVLPAVIVRTAHEAKTSFNRGMPQFTTTCSLEVKAVVEGATAAEAQDAIEWLWYAVENALLLDWSLVRMLQQFPSIESVLDIRAEGARHLAGIAGSFRCEYPEMYDPTADRPQPAPWPIDPPAPVPLERVGLHADLTNRADPTGTYPAPPFPQSVVPAPRTHGPDGRDEGRLDIPLEGD